MKPYRVPPFSLSGWEYLMSKAQWKHFEESKLVTGSESAARIAIAFATGPNRKRLIEEFYRTRPHRDREMDEILAEMQKHIAKAKSYRWEKRDDYEFDDATWLTDDDRLTALEARVFRLYWRISKMYDAVEYDWLLRPSD